MPEPSLPLSAASGPVPVECRPVGGQGARDTHLCTPRLLLRAMARSDIDAMLEARSRIEAAEHFDPVRHRRELETLWALFHEDWKQHGIGHLLIFARADGAIVGHVRLKGFARDSGDRGAELAFGIDEPYRGNGFAGEAVAAALLLAFEVAGIDPVVALVEPGNVPSIAVLCRCGFHRVGQGVAYNRPMERHLLSRASWNQSPCARRI